MKRIFYGVFILICSLSVYSCSSKVTNAPITPAPKPSTYIDTIAVAAKKSDFYVRMAFDLADMYLSVNTAANSVSRAHYGNDAKYLASYDFSSTGSTGIIKSSAFGGLEFEYLNVSSATITYSGLGGNLTNQLKRDIVVAVADTANITVPGSSGARRCQMKFYNTDMPGQLIVNINFSDGPYGFLNASGSSIVTPSGSSLSVLLQDPYLSVMNTSGTVNFTVTLNNISGQTQGVSEGHILSANDVFIIQGGSMDIAGNDNGVAYTVHLTYLNDEANGTITSTNGFSANMHVDRYDTYYYQPSTPDNRTYLLWDCPL